MFKIIIGHIYSPLHLHFYSNRWVLFLSTMATAIGFSTQRLIILIYTLSGGEVIVIAQCHRFMTSKGTKYKYWILTGMQLLWLYYSWDVGRLYSSVEKMQGWALYIFLHFYTIPTLFVYFLACHLYIFNVFILFTVRTIAYRV